MRVKVSYLKKYVPKDKNITVGDHRYHTCLLILKSINGSHFNSKKDLYKSIIEHGNINSKWDCGFKNFPSDVVWAVSKSIKDGYVSLKL